LGFGVAGSITSSNHSNQLRQGCSYRCEGRVQRMGRLSWNPRSTSNTIVWCTKGVSPRRIRPHLFPISARKTSRRENAGSSTSLRSGRDDIVSCYLARARTRVTSSGCSLAPIQSSTAAVTISVMRGSAKSRFSRNKSISRCSPNSPKSFSGSVTPSV
jgi:hypothetical protein